MKIVVKASGEIACNDTVLDELEKLYNNENHIVYVPGCGKELTKELEKNGFPCEFYGGYRVTREHGMLSIIDEVFEKFINKIYGNLKSRGCDVVAFHKVITAIKKYINDIDIGFVGEPCGVDEKLIQKYNEGYLIVLSSIATSKKSESTNILNCNADDVASYIAQRLESEALIYIVTSNGVVDDKGNTYTTLTPSQIHNLIENQVVTEGMIPKLLASLKAVKHNIPVYIINFETPISPCLKDEYVGTKITI